MISLVKECDLKCHPLQMNLLFLTPGFAQFLSFLVFFKIGHSFEIPSYAEISISLGSQECCLLSKY
jgi:hypothetical protein